MIPVRILGSAHLLPGRLVTTAEIVERTRPGKDPSRLEAATGIRARHHAEPGTRCADVGAAVLRDALADAGVAASALRRVIFVSSVGGDWVVPSTASAVIGLVGANGTCDGFDLQNACPGFLSALDVAARGVATGVGVTAIVAVELLSRLVGPEGPRAFGVFGDAAAAVVLGPARGGEGIRAICHANDWVDGPTIGVPQTALTRRMEAAEFSASADRMVDMAVAAMVRGVREVLARAELPLDEVQWVLPHQPNLPLLLGFAAALGLDPARLDPVVRDVGSVASAAVPLTLDRLLRSGRVRPGDRILMASVGSPLVYGAALYQCP